MGGDFLQQGQIGKFFVVVGTEDGFVDRADLENRAFQQVMGAVQKVLVASVGEEGVGKGAHDYVNLLVHGNAAGYGFHYSWAAVWHIDVVQIQFFHGQIGRKLTDGLKCQKVISFRVIGYGDLGQIGFVFYEIEDIRLGKDRGFYWQHAVNQDLGVGAHVANGVEGV